MELGAGARDRSKFIQLDIRDEEMIGKHRDKIVKSFGGLDISSQRPQTAATSVVLGEMDANSVDKTEIPHLIENAFFSNIIL